MNNTAEFRSLQTELTRLVLLGVAGLLLCAWLLTTLTSLANALLYSFFSSSLWLLIWQQSHTRLHLNRAEQTSALYPTLGWANRMTIGRGWLIAATGGFLIIPGVLLAHPIVGWAAALMYTMAAIFDRVDGFVARRSGQTSLLGARLDTVFDALGLLLAPLLALQLGKIHVSYLLVSVAYYLFVLGVKSRENNHKPVFALPPSPLRRTLAGFQMFYVAGALWPVFNADVTVVAGFGFMVPLLIGFGVDWLVVSGRLQPKQGLDTCLRRLSQITRQWLLPILRLALVLVFWVLLNYLDLTASWQTTTVTGLFALGGLMMILGLAGRAGAVLVLILLASAVALPVNSWPFAASLFGTITLLLFGCGSVSLWQADDDWVNRQDGA